MSLGKDNGETNARKENTRTSAKTAAERPHQMNNSHTAELVELAETIPMHRQDWLMK